MIISDVCKRGIFALVLLLCANARIASAAEWQSDWDNTLAAAKKENLVTVITDVTASMRDALTISFQSKYGLQVDLLGALGREIPPRVSRRAKSRTISLGCLRPWHDHWTRINDTRRRIRSSGADTNFP
ncbi:MAG TPA: hypothetical protein VFW91_04380 [Candidatus Binatia bacterium]|nr:hypothetical protein [Candidatus Binatia bacterium]